MSHGKINAIDTFNVEHIMTPNVGDRCDVYGEKTEMEHF